MTQDRLLGFIFGVAGAAISALLIGGGPGYAGAAMCFVCCIGIGNTSSLDFKEKLVRWIAIDAVMNVLVFGATFLMAYLKARHS